MIYGIGIDIVQISRFKKAIDRWGERFIDRIFTPEEIRYCQDKQCPEESFALRFAAKEALFKAIGKWPSWREIEVRRKGGEKPEIILMGNTAKLQNEKDISNIHISLSHHGDYAIAEVILEVR